MLKIIRLSKNLNISSLKFTYLNILKPAKTSTWYFYKILFQLLALNYQFRYNNKNYTWRLTIFPPLSVGYMHCLRSLNKHPGEQRLALRAVYFPALNLHNGAILHLSFLFWNNHWLKLYLFQQDRFAGFISLHDSKYKIVLDNEIFK